MNSSRTSITDKIAISLSSLCVLHCFLTPMLLVVAPSLSVLGLESEWFHIWMVVGVLPISLYSLNLGCKQHKQPNFFRLGVVGIALLVSALFIEDRLFGEAGEKILTLLGSVLIVVAHYFNYTRCQNKKQQTTDCGC